MHVLIQAAKAGHHPKRFDPDTRKTLVSGKRKEPKPKLFGPDISGVGRGVFHVKGWGAKKFGMPLETREIKLFGRDIPGFCRDIPAAPEKFEKNNLCSILVPYSGPLDRLNAILSLLHPLDRYRTPSAIGSAIGRPLSRPISHPDTGGSPQPPHSKPLRGLNRAIVAL